jgi:hypothetical protein
MESAGKGVAYIVALLGCGYWPIFTNEDDARKAK